MTPTSDIDRLVASWLQTAGPVGLPDEVLDRALDQARQAGQRRGLLRSIGAPTPWPASRGAATGLGGPLMVRFLMVATLVLLAGAIAAIAGSRVTTRVVPTTGPTAGPTVAPASEVAAPDVLRGTWVASNPGIAELNAGTPTIQFLVAGDGTRAWVVVGDQGWYGSLRWASQADAPEAGLLRLVASASDHGCVAGDEGRYRSTLSEDGSMLTLDVVDDACPARGRVLGRSWTRTLAGTNSGGRGIVDTFEPAFWVTLPKGSYTASLTSGAVDIHNSKGRRGDFSFQHTGRDNDVLPQLTAFFNVDGFTDPCLVGSRVKLQPGIDAVVRHFQKVPGMTVQSTSQLTVGGYPAMRMVLDAESPTRCQSGKLYELMPSADPTIDGWWLLPGDRDLLYVVEVGLDTVIFSIQPPDAPEADAIISSITFPDASASPTP